MELPLAERIATESGRFAKIIFWLSVLHVVFYITLLHDDVIKWKHLLLALRAGISPVTGEFPSQRPVTRSFDVFLICVPEQTVVQTIETPVISGAIALIMTSL